MTSGTISGDRILWVAAALTVFATSTWLHIGFLGDVHSSVYREWVAIVIGFFIARTLAFAAGLVVYRRLSTRAKMLIPFALFWIGVGSTALSPLELMAL